MLTVIEFEEQHYKRKIHHCMWPGTLVEGMLTCTEQAGYSLQAYKGNFVYFRAVDCQLCQETWHPGYVLPSIKELEQRHRFSTSGFPYGKYGTPAENEEHLQIRLASLTGKQLKDWEARKFTVEQATQEFPYSLYLAGCDDSSYTKWYATKEEMLEELALFKALEPIDDDAFLGNGFVFTN